MTPGWDVRRHLCTFFGLGAIALAFGAWLARAARPADLWIVPAYLLGAGCAPGAESDERGAQELAAPRPDALRVGAPIDLRKLTVAAKNRFRPGTSGTSGTRGLTASGLGHALEVRERFVRVRAAAPPLERQALTGPARAALMASGAGAASRLRALRKQMDALRAADAAALELETVSIGRAGFQCVSGTGRVLAGDGGAAVRDFGACSERWTSGPDAGEVAFQFPERPGGRGDLVLAVRASAGGGDTPLSVASDARGLHLAGAGGARFFYGHGTW